MGISDVFICTFLFGVSVLESPRVDFHLLVPRFGGYDGYARERSSYDGRVDVLGSLLLFLWESCSEIIIV